MPQGINWLEQLARDVRFGVRNLSKTPGFVASAIISLALGIGATTSLFSVIYGVILHPFPYAHPETLYSFYATVPGKHFAFTPSTPEGYLEIQRRVPAFSDLLASSISDVTWTAIGEPQRLRGNFCSTNTFRVMGVKPLLGRYILPRDGDADAQAVAVLGYKFWQRQFNGDPHVLGRKLRLNDRIRTVVGVMPKRFMWRGADVYLPVVFERGHAVEDASNSFFIGRLRPGATLAEARSQLYPVLAEMLTTVTGTHVKAIKVVLQDFYDTFPSGIRTSLWILFGAVGVLLLIACANVSSLLLARSAARSREMAIRLSLGAGRFRIVRQLLTESALIGLAAGALGVLIAFAGLHLILSITPPDTIPDEAEVTLNWAALLFTLLISLASALLFGLAPAFQAGRSNVSAALKAGGRGMSGLFGETRLRNFFVVAEVALSMVLLVSASLVIRTLLHLERLPVGAQPEKVITMTIPLSDRAYATKEARNNFCLRLLEKARQIPGLTEVGLSDFLHPFVYFETAVAAPGHPANSSARSVVSEVSSDYTKLVNVHLLQGRRLSPADVEGARRVAMVNQKFAATFFPRGDSVGQSVHLKELHPPSDPVAEETVTIVGVLSDIPNEGLGEKVQPEVYVPFTLTGYRGLSVILMARSALSPVSLIKPLEAAIHKLDPDQPVMEIRTYREWLDLRGYAEPKFSVFLFGVFAGLGLVLTALGIYAVTNYSVLRRTQEIGLRMALGAQRGGILSMVVGSGARLIALGVAIGLAASFATAGLLKGMLSGVSPFDPLSFCAVVALLFSIGLAACLRPALRAARIDPMQALQYE